MTRPPDAQPPPSEAAFYEAPDGEVSLSIRVTDDTLWLTQRQMADLFRTTSGNVSRHLRNVFAEGELDPSSTIQDFAAVRTEGSRQVRRTLTHYDLDAVISVGYRTDSKRAVPFRRWAEQVLRSRWLVTSLEGAVRNLATEYAETWRLLLEYDEDRLELPAGDQPASTVLGHVQAVSAIADLKAALTERGQASPVFGIPRGDALREALTSALHTMNGHRRQTPEERASNLLCTLVVDRPFVEGNNRIAALLFLLYTRQEGITHDLNPQALTALTLLIAQSEPANKDLMVRLVVHLLAEPTR